MINGLLQLLINETNCGVAGKTLYNWTLDNGREDEFIDEDGERHLTDLGHKLVEMARNDFSYDELNVGYWVLMNLC